MPNMSKEGRKKNSEAMKKRWAAFRQAKAQAQVEPRIENQTVSEVRFPGLVVRASEDKILIERC